MEATTNHIFFATLTYRQEMLPVLITSTGYEIPYADIRDVRLMIKRIRKDNLFGRPFRYFYCSELGSKRGRPHFHVLFLVPKYPKDNFNTCLQLEHVMKKVVFEQWKRNVGPSDKFPQWEPLCEFHAKIAYGKVYSNYDLHYVNPASSPNGETDVAFYVLKYMMKTSDREVRRQRALRLNLPEDEYESVWNLVKSKHNCSHFFGLSDPSHVAYIKRCVEMSNPDDYPKFFNKVNGKSYPLARYYKQKGECYSLDDSLKFRVPEDYVYVRDLDLDGTKANLVIEADEKRRLRIDDRDITAVL